MIWRIAMAVGLVLTACGESPPADLAAENAPQVSTAENEGEAIAGEHPGAAVFQVDQECRSRGSVDGLESTWRVDGLVPDEWRDRETVDGILRHSQDGWATFTETDTFAVIEVTDFGSSFGGCVAWAVNGDETAAVFEVDEECSNGGGVIEAFGIAWSSAPNNPPADWRFLETVEGILHFETFERSYFVVDGHKHEVTTMEVEASCEAWPSLDEVSDASLVTGTATMFRPLSAEEGQASDELDPGPAGELGLVGCRWRSPGLYSFDMTWTPEGDVDWPVTILVTQTILRGDTGLGWGGFVTLRGPGEFSIPHDAYQANRLLGDETASANRSTLRNEQDVQCYLDDPVKVDVDPLPAKAGTDGSIEQLISRLEPESPLSSLAAFVPQAAGLGIDRLFVASTRPLQSISASWREGCLNIFSTYATDLDIDVYVEQTLRCPEEDLPQLTDTVTVSDDVWRVQVSGHPDVVDELASEIEDFPFAGVGQLDAAEGLFDAEAAIETAVEEWGFTEVARVPWDDGLVAIGFTNADFSVERYADPIVSIPRRLNGGGGGTGCEDYAIVTLGDLTRGFTFVVVEDANHDVVLRVAGDATVLPAIPAADGRALVFIDNPDYPEFVANSLSIVDAAGEQVPCMQ